MTRREKLTKIFENIDENEREIINPLIDEVVYLENRMTELKQYPFLSVHPKNPHLQKQTAAAKQYKECSQSYMNAIRILCGVLHKANTSAEDELLKRLEEF